MGDKLVKTLGVVTATLLFVVCFVPFTISAQPGAALVPPSNDYGEDTDADGFYDSLVVEVTVEVYEAASYYVGVWLNDSEGVPIHSVGTSRPMSVGTNVVSIPLEGIRIWAHGVDGPYVVWVHLCSNNPLTQIDAFIGLTNSYTYDQFEPLPAMFELVTDASGADIDGNRLFEFLVIDFTMEVSEENDYRVICRLMKLINSAWTDISEIEETMHLVVGAHALSISVKGGEINAAELDGPYHILLMLHDFVDGIPRSLDDVWYVTESYSFEEFEVGSITSTSSSLAPTIDGSYGADEWNDATLVDLGRPEMGNPFDAALLVKNNMTHLYFCIDVVADLTEDSGDYAAIAFDSGNDNDLTDGSEDQFVIGSVPDQTVHQVYSESAMDWVIHCEPFDGALPNHSGLVAAAGFGTSVGSEEDHRVYELAVPLDLIGVTPGSVVGFATNGIESRGIFDASVNNGSSWPYFMDAGAPLVDYGDLTIGWSTIASISGVAGENGWYISSVDVELNATSSAGVANTFYSLNSGDWQTYTHKFTIDTDGHNTLAYYSVDSYGSEETIKTTQVSIDEVAPESSIVMTGIVGSDGWFTSAINVALDAVDGTSGVGSIAYALDDAQWNAYEAEFVIDEDGSHALLVRSEDVAGNIEETQLVEFRIDTTEPSLLILSPDEGTLIRGNDVTVSWESTDNILIKTTEVSIDGNEWSIVNSTDADGALNMELGHGEHTVQLRVTDSAGNTNVSSVTFHINSSALSFSGPYYGLPLIGVIAVIVAAVAVIGNRLRGRRSGASVPSSKDPDGDSPIQP